MNITLSIDDLADGKVIQLLEEHHREMHLYSPEESIHALDKTALFDPSLTLWCARVGDEVAACGGLFELSEHHGEIKAMRTAKAFLRRGIAEQILRTLLQEATQRRYTRVSLETGTHNAFMPAVALYKKLGFTVCGPFGNYALDPYSQFLTKELA